MSNSKCRDRNRFSLREYRYLNGIGCATACKQIKEDRRRSKKVGNRTSICVIEATSCSTGLSLGGGRHHE
jgi:hypothetical protein